MNTGTMAGSGVPARVWAGYYLVFCALWALIELVGREPVVEWLGSETAALGHIVVVKTLVWVVPAVILIRRFEPSLRVSLKEMFTARVRWGPALIGFGVFTFWVASALGAHWPAQGLVVTFPLVGVVRGVFAGVQEEIVFRGWLCNAMPNWGNWKGYLASGALFAVIHVPAWVKNPSQVEGWACLYTPLSLVFFGALLAWVFAKGRNLVVPIVLHSWYDLALAALPVN
ncbi:MAG: CPBP family intramembrane metalloprotease [Bifidobacteriaceae bacterium]|nr:CPBP family intramembrane metalloprotease [Bifidobacteriaceae bacterium]